MTVDELCVLLAWVSGVVTADDACRALRITRTELREWEMDALATGRRIVASASVQRIEVIGRGTA